MATLAPIAERLGKFVRLLSSDKDGEVVAAARAIMRTLAGEGLDIHALADSLALAQEAAAEHYLRGLPAGRREARNAEPTWHEIATECAEHLDRLREHEQKFVRDMVRRTVRGGAPTEKQANWLRAIYARTGHEQAADF
jgi:hypothetical protein